MKYQTFCVILDYLLYSGKISIDSKNKIGWIHYPENTDKHIKNKHLFWNNQKLDSQMKKSRNGLKNMIKTGIGEYL